MLPDGFHLLAADPAHPFEVVIAETVLADQLPQHLLEFAVSSLVRHLRRFGSVVGSGFICAGAGCSHLATISPA